ncbi:MAG: ABC transporter substrate-binding protein [Chloroflexi bacterium]|nr:ABC transporter substrate-binding protein [Chloroflexota bacterium]
MLGRPKNWWFRISGTVFACVLLISTMLGCAPKAAPGATTPIKIGILYPFTGPTAWLGQRQLRGWEMAFGQVDNKIAGRTVQFVVEDTQGDPKVGVTKATKLIEKDQVNLLGGIVMSSVALAVRDVVHRSGTPLVISMANAGAMTQDQRSPYIFRTFGPGGSGSFYMAQYLYKQLGIRTAVFSGQDYAYGREHGAMFKKEFERLGGKVLFENYAPIGTADFGPYVTELGKWAGKAEAIQFVYSGTDANRFINALGEFGVKDKFKVLANYGATGDGSSAREQGKNADGIYGITYWVYDVDNKTTKDFLALDEKKGGQPPFDPLDENGYIAAQAVIKALQKVNGNVEDKEKFLKALREVEFDSTRGRFRFDSKSQNWVMTFFITKMEKVTGGKFEAFQGPYQAKVISTLRDVPDPWWLEHPDGK